MENLLSLLAVLTAFSSPVKVQTGKLPASDSSIENGYASDSSIQNGYSLISEPWLRPLLPDSIEPVEYILTLLPDFYFEGSTFSGNVSIRLKVHNETDAILVHIEELNVTDYALLDQDGGHVNLSNVFEYKPNEYWVAKTVNPLQAGTEATLRLHFSGSLESWSATTMSQLTEARKAFPCFDEPRFKAQFTTTLRHWRNFTARSNMPLQSSVVLDDIWQDSTFATTPLMSTSLVAFIISDFAYTNNTFNDGKEDAKPNSDLKPFMSSWIYLMDYPVVNLDDVADEIMNMTVSRERFLLDPTTDPQSPPTQNGYYWFIPTKYRTKEGISGIFWLNDINTRLENPVKSSDSWLLLNYDHCGYYVVNYNLELWNRLKHQLIDDHLILNEVERSKLLHDALFLARAEQLNYSIALDLTEYARKETGLLPWDTIYASFQYINAMMVHRSEHHAFLSYVRNLTTDIMNELEVEDKGDQAEKVLRSRMMGMACYSGHEACKSNATRLFRAWIEDNTVNVIPVQLRRDVYREGLSNSSVESDWLIVRSRYSVATTDQEKDTLLYALSGTRSIELMERLLEDAFDEHFIRSKDFIWLIAYVASNTDVDDCVWQWFKRNYDLIIDKFGVFMIEFALPEIVSSFNTRRKQQEVRDWFQYRPGVADGCKAAVLQRIDANIRWTERSLPDVVRWLIQHYAKE